MYHRSSDSILQIIVGDVHIFKGRPALVIIHFFEFHSILSSSFDTSKQVLKYLNSRTLHSSVPLDIDISYLPATAIHSIAQQHSPLLNAAFTTSSIPSTLQDIHTSTMAIIENTKLASRVSSISTPMAPHTTSQSSQIALMLRLSPLCSTPILIDPDTTYEGLLQQIQTEVYERAPHFASGFEFDGLYIEWDQTTPGFPCSSNLDEHNFAATMALVKARQGKSDVLCIKATVAKAGVPMKLVL